MNRHERIRLGGSVRRYHTKQVHNFQNVAAHSWGVACILLDIVPQEEQSVNLLRAALYHDVAEYDTGDTPAHAKWASPELKKSLDDFEARVEREFNIGCELSPFERSWLKLADMLELMWYVLEERRMGNKNVNEIFVRGYEYVMNIIAYPVMTVPAVENQNEKCLHRKEYIEAFNMIQYINEEYEHACE